ncbi:MAG: M1 family peptidase, partial [Deltaproteobacteria bacterium]|nr:M1 family peptidase [Kofleriaceae bacterium]
PILQGAAERDEGRAVAIAFTLEHFDALRARLPGDTAGFLVGILASGCDRATAERRPFVEQHLGELRGARRRIEQAFERVDQCIARRAAVEPALAAWLKRAR